MQKQKNHNSTTAHLWCDGHSISINACGMWGARAGVQASKRELHTHIYLNQVRVEILSCIKKKKKKPQQPNIQPIHLYSQKQIHMPLRPLGLKLEREKDQVWLGESPQWLFELSGFWPWRSDMGLGLYQKEKQRGKDQFGEEREDWVGSCLTHFMRSNPCQPSLNSVLRTNPATKLPWSKPSSLMAQSETCMSSP